MNEPTDESLRDLLQREAETAPGIRVPDDTWRRGRRRHHRTLALRAAAAVGVVALVGFAPGLVDRSTDREPPQPADGGSLGVPDRFDAVPDRMSDRDNDGAWFRDEVTDDLATGPGAAAWVTAQGLPVLVDADDGDYHLLDLPDVVTSSPLATAWLPGDVVPLALSPDGTRLAYGYAEPGGGDTRVPSGLRVVDLRTGQVVREIALPGGAGVAVTAVTWSPGGAWLAWSGFEASSWTTTSIGGRDRAAGLVAPDDSRRSIVPGTALLVDDTGTAVVVDRGRLRTVDPRGRTTTRRWDASRTDMADNDAVLAPDGRRVALGVYDGYDLVTLALGDGRVEVGADGMPDDRPWQVHPLGWVDDAVLVQRDPNDGSDGVLSLVSVDAQSAPRDVARVENGVGTLSVAIDLVAAGRPTLARPAPDWPWSEERWVVTTTLGALGVMALLGGALLVLRRRRRKAREDVVDG